MGKTGHNGNISPNIGRYWVDIVSGTLKPNMIFADIMSERLIFETMNTISQTKLLETNSCTLSVLI